MLDRLFHPSLQHGLLALWCFSNALPAQDPALEVGKPLSGTLQPGEQDSYTVEIKEPSFVLGEVDQSAIDVEIVVFGADGDEAARIDALGRGGERFSGRMRRPGTYRVQLELADEDSSGGEYTITLRRLEPIATDPARLTDQLMSRYDGADSPGAAVQVWRDGRTIYSKAYGTANLTYGIPFETETRTNIGSTSKQFTAFAVMLEQERGALSLDDDIRKHIPELPEFEQTITIRHLLTHTSGLREFLNLLVMAGRRLDRGDWVDRDELIEIVKRQPKLQNEPGTEWNYNNTAFGLAALIVERTSGQSFDTFMAEKVFGPLGMTQSMVRVSPLHIVPGRAEGYTPGPDGYLEIGDLGGAVGAGAIYSTVEDLQKWVQNYASARVGSAAIFKEMMTPYVLANGKATNYGYGLGIDEHRGLRRVQHNGADVAHRSSLVYYPEINAGITTQSNHAEFNSALSFTLAEAFFADAMTPEETEEDPVEEVDPDGPALEEYDPENYDPETFDELVGRYALDAKKDFILTFSRDGDELFVQATAQPRLSITPTSGMSFKLNRVEASVTFHRDEEGRIEGLTLFQNGERHATRIETAKPTDRNLEDFVGRYFSDEIETFYVVSLEDGELVAKQRRLGEAQLEEGDGDTFTWKDLVLTFERDRNGNVIGFYLSSGRTRDVRFSRQR